MKSLGLNIPENNSMEFYRNYQAILVKIHSKIQKNELYDNQEDDEETESQSYVFLIRSKQKLNCNSKDNVTRFKQHKRKPDPFRFIELTSKGTKQTKSHILLGLHSH